MIKELFDEKRSKLVLDFMYSCGEVASDQEFRDLMRLDLPRLLPHDLILFGYGKMDTRQALKLININYPDSYLSKITNETDGIQTIQSPLLEIVLEKKASVYIGDIKKLRVFSENWWNMIRRNQIHDSLICGLPVNGEREGCTVTLANCFIKEKDIEKAEMMMNLLLPIMHKAIVRIYDIPRGAGAGAYKLTHKERQLLEAVCAGCSNKEIAEQFTVSVHTVRNRLHTIFQKLDVKTRTEAINKAHKTDILPG